MISNRLQYLAKKNKKFLSRRSGYKGSRKEDQKGCFNCKKPEHFIVDCCNALSNYLIILLDDMVYVYILYDFDDFVTYL